VTECEMPETANDFAAAGYTTFHPLVPKGKSKTKVIILFKNGLVTSANIHVCPDLMDNQIQLVWLQFGPVSSMGGFTLCGVYRTWSDQDGRVFTAPEAAERLDALSGQITRAAKRYARVVDHGDLNLDLDHVYTRGFPHASSRVLADSTTDHRPVITTIASGGSRKLLTKLSRRPFKAIRREALESALEHARDWSGIYAIKEVEEVHKLITGGIIAALNAVAPVKEIVVKTRSNLYLTRETPEMMRRRDAARAGTPRY
jgi:hypothetical protein